MITSHTTHAVDCSRRPEAGPVLLTPRRRALLASASAVLAVTLAVPAVAQDAEDADPDEVQEDLDETRDELDEARGSLEEVNVEAQRASEELAGVEQRLADAAVRLRGLEEDVDVASAALEAAREATRESSAEVAAADADVARAEEQLARVQARLDDQVRSAYMYAPTVPTRLSVAQLVTTAEGPDDVLHGSGLLERAAGGEAEAVESMGDLRAELVERKAELAEVRARLSDQEAAAARLREQVDAARERQTVVQAEAAADRQRADALVEQLEVAKSRWAEEIASLEAESAALEEKLRASQWRPEAPSSESGFAWPTQGSPGSPFGYRIHPIYGTRRLHTGVDVGAPSGQQIVAAADGLAVEAGWKGGYGNAVVLDHGGGIATLYAHQSRLAVSPGTVVTRGQVIGYIGSTGASTGPHLHLEVRVNGVPQDPMKWFG